ncbi:MAG: hypothetical protein LBG43_02700 [Treponema sp.]|nr:hypothetical protein [Treponema sp.]
MKTLKRARKPRKPLDGNFHDETPSDALAAPPRSNSGGFPSPPAGARAGCRHRRVHPAFHMKTLERIARRRAWRQEFGEMEATARLGKSRRCRAGRQPPRYGRVD